MNQSIKTGVVGYGYAASTFHIPLLCSNSGYNLTAISTSQPAKVRETFAHVNIYAAPDQLFAQTDIELVIIPTPNDSHYPLARQALLAGKHVVLDKPFTLTVAEADELIALAEQQNRILSVFHNRRWDSDFLTLQRLIEDRQLGEISHFESHFDRYRPLVRDRWRENGGAGSGLWFDLGPHLLDQTLQLFGKPESIYLELARQRSGAKADDWFHAILSYGTAKAILHGSALVPAAGPRFIVHGSSVSFVKYGLDIQEDQLRKGMLPGNADWGLDPHPGCLTSIGNTGPQEHCVAAARGSYETYYNRLHECIVSGAPNPVPAGEALWVMQLLEAGLASVRDQCTQKIKL
ncbi:MAG: oxidoreductase [Spirochaetes bacterium]|nr:oxidoreductase [Spirochaetota bacterium]MBU0954720.1 oxidoreductase [Spirochaetota bacterium]